MGFGNLSVMLRDCAKNWEGEEDDLPDCPSLLLAAMREGK